MDINTIIRACRKHGARTVHDASYAALVGRDAALRACGLQASGLIEMHHINAVAYKSMSASERAAELADLVDSTMALA